MNRIDTFTKLFLDRTRQFPNEIIYTYKKEGIWVDITWQEYGETVREAANALLAMGFQKGERAICLSKNRWEWYYYAMSVVMAGGIIVGIYPTSPPQECKYIIEHSEARFILLEDQEQVDKILHISDELPKLERAIVIEKYGPRNHTHLMSLESFHQLGKEFASKNPELYEKRALGYHRATESRHDRS